MKAKIIWYDMNEQKAVDIIDNIKDEEDALSKGYLKYNGNPPGKMHTIIITED